MSSSEARPTFIARFSGVVAGGLLLVAAITAIAAEPTAGDAIASTPPPLQASCADNLRALRIEAGDKATVQCPRRCTRQPVWGTDTYSADSSVCAAAVHAGLISASAGGLVEVRASGAEQEFSGTERNGVRSQPWGPWPTSFTLSAASAPASAADEAPARSRAASMPVRPRRVTCTTQAQDIRGEEGLELVLLCPQDCSAGSVYGTDDYFEGSAICRAAIHAGAITEAQGGVFTMTIGGAKRRFLASDQNGVSSRTWGPWSRSFSISAAP